MRILLATPWFSPHTGYIENGLPKALAALGHDVLVVTSPFQPGYALPQYPAVYAPFMGPPVQPLGEATFGELRVIRLSPIVYRGHIALRGLGSVVEGFRPDVVQTFSVNTPLTLQLARLQRRGRFRLFLGAHRPAVAQQDGSSLLVRTPARAAADFVSRWLPGRFVASRSELCYAVTDDCALVAERVNGVPRDKIRRASLGVDTSIYRPLATDPQRAALRSQYGFTDADVVCVYSGRFDNVKNPLLLARAVQLLRDRGEPFRCLFIGGGQQEQALRDMRGSVTLPLMSQESLAAHFRASDVAVWPFGYSSSQLDALGCGLPLVLSDALDDASRVDGCGMQFRDGDANDLARTLGEMRDSAARRLLGQVGAQRISRSLSWTALASARCIDYLDAIRKSEGGTPTTFRQRTVTGTV